MKISAKRTLWWGIGAIVLGVLAVAGSTSAGLQASMISQPVSQSLYFWLVSPGLLVVQNIAFPLGAALIAASAVIRYIDRRSEF